MKTYKFNCAEHEEYGGTGWCPAWMKHADPLPGMGVAHDIMEHPANDQGTVEDEVRAFGAMLYTRHEGGWWHMQGQRSTDWDDNANGELAEFLYKWGYGDSDWLRSRPSKRTVALEDDNEAQIVSCWDKMRKHLRSEHEGEPSVEKLIADGMTDGHFLRFRQLVREGYRMARKRWNNADPCELSHLFDRIAKKADNLLKYANEGYDQLVVKIDRKRMDVSVEIVSPTEDDNY